MDRREAAVLARLFDRIAQDLEQKRPNVKEAWEVACTARQSLEDIAGFQECENLASDLGQLSIWREEHREKVNHLITTGL